MGVRWSLHLMCAIPANDSMQDKLDAWSTRLWRCLCVLVVQQRHGAPHILQHVQLACSMARPFWSYVDQKGFVIVQCSDADAPATQPGLSLRAACWAPRSISSCKAKCVRDLPAMAKDVSRVIKAGVAQGIPDAIFPCQLLCMWDCMPVQLHLCRPQPE